MLDFIPIEALKIRNRRTFFSGEAAGMPQLFDFDLVAELVRAISVLINIEFAFIEGARSVLEIHIWLIVHMILWF